MKKQTKNQSAAQEKFAADLGVIFSQIPGMDNLFSKNIQPPVDETGEPDDRLELIQALIECKAVIHRIAVISSLVEDLTLKSVSPQRILALLGEIESLTTDGRNIIEAAGL